MKFVLRFASAAALATLSACQTAPVPTWDVPAGAIVAPVNGYPMAYLERGVGPTIVLVHGVMCDYRCFFGQLDGMSKDFRVVAVSLRHFYPEKWDGRGDDFTVAQHAKDLTSLIERVGGPVYLVGHSYGAQIAYEVARARPDLIRKLVLGEAPTDSLVAPIDRTVDEGRSRQAETIAATFKAGNMEDSLQSAVDAINGVGVWQRLPPIAKTISVDNAWTVVGLLRQSSPQVTCDEFGSLKMPVLLVVGGNTTERFRNDVQAQSKCLPTALTATIKGGHGSPYQNPAEFNAAVKAFLLR